MNCNQDSRKSFLNLSKIKLTNLLKTRNFSSKKRKKSSDKSRRRSRSPRRSRNRRSRSRSRERKRQSRSRSRSRDRTKRELKPGYGLIVPEGAKGRKLEKSDEKYESKFAKYKSEPQGLSIFSRLRRQFKFQATREKKNMVLQKNFRPRKRPLDLLQCRVTRRRTMWQGRRA